MLLFSVFTILVSAYSHSLVDIASQLAGGRHDLPVALDILDCRLHHVHAMSYTYHHNC